MTDKMAIIAMMAMLATVNMMTMIAIKAMISTKAMIAMKALMGIGKSDSILIPGSRELMENSWAVAWLDSKSR